MEIQNSKRINEPLVSVIIPVYGTESLLRRCLDSVTRQTYTNLEIIVVNDCSPGDCRKIMQEYQIVDQRIKYVEHEKNKGLFHARLTGASHMTGEFITFVDSDDYIGIDYYRLLVKAAQEEKADIVCANMIMVNESDDRHYVHMMNRPSGKILKGQEILDAYFEQEGLAFHWHAVWNKIYSKKVWEQAYPHYSKIQNHLIMAEDFAYSTVLFYYAKKYISIDYEGYYYFQNANASTSLQGNINKYLKNIGDLGTAFSFVKSFLIDNNIIQKYELKFKAWEARYSRFWTDNINNSLLPKVDKKKAFNQLKKAFEIEEFENTTSSDHYFYSTSVDWDNRLEKLKVEIASDSYQYISFDVFDTLIVRPFMDPHDLFLLLDNYYEKISNNKTAIEKFSKYRNDAEMIIRRKLKAGICEDVTLDEIYEYIVKNYGVSNDIADKIKLMETELEIKYCKARQSALELYQMIQHLGKKIIIVSDMYLPKEAIETILQQNGFVNYDKLYLSGEVKKSKFYGSLYKHLLGDLKCLPEEILHIGDSWASDIVRAEEHGISTYFYPKAIERFLNHIPDKETGNSTLLYFEPRGKWINYKYGNENFLIRCMLATVANKYFDNPYRVYSEWSDFNGDPYLLGYYAVGMHTVAISKWILEDAIKEKYNKVQFVARDGHIVKKVYDHLTTCYKGAPTSNYLYLSRKAMIPTLINDVNSLYSIESLINLYVFTPRKIMELILKKEITQELSAMLAKHKINLDEKFSDVVQYHEFIKVLKQIDIDLTNLEGYKKIVSRYLKNEVDKNDAIFDIGYSGTAQMIMAELGVNTDAYYIHLNTDTAKIYSQKLDYNVKSFYDFSPSISGTLREYVFSRTEPSCIGYMEQDSNVIPEFEGNMFTYIEQYIVNTIHDGAEEFVVDFIHNFGEYIPDFEFRNIEASMPYEMFLHSAKEHDRKIFAECYFEDDTYHGESKINLMNEWNGASNYHRLPKAIEEMPVHIVESHQPYDFLNNKGKVYKALFYFLYNRKVFKEKVKTKIQLKLLKVK